MKINYGYYSILFLCILAGCEQSSQTLFIEKEEYKGILFKKDFSVTFTDGEAERAVHFVPGSFSEGWDPTFEDIEITEQNLFVYNKDSLGFDNLNNYFRQYIGYKDTLGENIIWINLVSIKNIRDELLSMPLIIQDADSLVFTINYRISDSTFFDFRFY